MNLIILCKSSHQRWSLAYQVYMLCKLYMILKRTIYQYILLFVEGDTGGEFDEELSLPLLLLLPARALRELRVVGKSFGTAFFPNSEVQLMPSNIESRRKFRSGIKFSAIQTKYNPM